MLWVLGTKNAKIPKENVCINLGDLYDGRRRGEERLLTGAKNQIIQENGRREMMLCKRFHLRKYALLVVLLY